MLKPTAHCLAFCSLRQRPLNPTLDSGYTQTFYYSFVGLDPACSSGAGSAANSCGVHMHVGASCQGNAGGHYYTELKRGAVTADPWISIAYESIAGASAGNFSVDTGATEAQAAGRSFIVHAFDGSRIACGILAQSETMSTSWPSTPPSPPMSPPKAQLSKIDAAIAVAVVLGISVGLSLLAKAFLTKKAPSNLTKTPSFVKSPSQVTLANENE